MKRMSLSDTQLGAKHLAAMNNFAMGQGFMHNNKQLEVIKSVDTYKLSKNQGASTMDVLT